MDDRGLNYAEKRSENLGPLYSLVLAQLAKTAAAMPHVLSKYVLFIINGLLRHISFEAALSKEYASNLTA